MVDEYFEEYLLLRLWVACERPGSGGEGNDTRYGNKIGKFVEQVN
jgi:hypothetical protein